MSLIKLLYCYTIQQIEVIEFSIYAIIKIFATTAI